MSIRHTVFAVVMLTPFIYASELAMVVGDSDSSLERESASPERMFLKVIHKRGNGFEVRPVESVVIEKGSDSSDLKEEVVPEVQGFQEVETVEFDLIHGLSFDGFILMPTGQVVCRFIKLRLDREFVDNESDKKGAQVMLPLHFAFKNCKTVTDFMIKLQEIRNFLSYKPFEYEVLVRLKEQFDGASNQSEDFLKMFVSHDQVKWSGQTIYEAFMGHLFFPVQFDCLFETSSILHTREHMQNMIALSASYGNVLAQYHLDEILSMYDESYLDDEMYMKLDTLVDSFPGSLNEDPHYYCGLLCINMLRMENACEHFKLGYASGDVWCTYHYGLEFRGEVECKPIIEALSGLNRGLTFLLEADFEDDGNRFEKYIEAGNAGVAEGYNVAGILAADENEALLQYSNAAQGGIIGAYDDIAEIYREKQDYDKMKEIYRKKGESGDEKGFVQCADLFWREGNYTDAKKWYEKAGVCGYDYLIEYADSKKSREKLKLDRDEMLNEKIKRLKRDELGEAN